MATLNVFLRTHLLRTLTNKAGRSFQLEYAHAHAWVPWRVHAEGVTIHAGEDNVEWGLTIDSVDFGVHPLLLLHRLFKATQIDATGVTFRIRLLESAPLPAHDRYVPPIAGFGDVPLRPIGPPVTVTDATYHLFGVDLEDVDARDVREVWVDTVRIIGDFRIHGRWAFQPLRHLEVGPAHVDVNTISLGRGEDTPFFADVHGQLSTTVDRYDPRVPTLAETMRFLSVEANLEGVLRAPDALRECAPKSGLEISTGEGPFEMHASLSHGVFQPGSVGHVEMPAIRARRGDLSADAVLEAVGHVDPHRDADGDVLSSALDVTLRNVRFGTTADSASPPAARAATVRATVSTPNADLTKAFDDVRYEITADEITAPRIDPIVARFTQGAAVSIRSGAVRANGHLAGSVSRGTGQGNLRVAIDRLAVSSGGNAGSSDVDAHVAVRAFDILGQTLDLGGSALELRASAVRSAGPKTSVQAMTLRAPALSFVKRSDGVVARGSLEVDARGFLVEARGASASGDATARAESWRVSGGSAGVSVALGPAQMALEHWVARTSTTNASEVSAVSASLTLSTQQLAWSGGRPSGHLHFEAPNLEFRRLGDLSHFVAWPAAFVVDDGALTVRASGDIGLGQPSLAATARVEAHALKVHSGSRALTGDATLNLVARRPEGSAKTLLAGTSLAVDHVHGPGANEWWARVVLGEGGIQDAGDGWHGQLSAQLEAKDATPVEPFVANASGVPKWVLGLVSLPNVRADGEASFAPGSLDIRGLDIRGGLSAVRVELAKRDHESRGLVLVHLGALHAGFGLGEEKPRVVLVAPDAWFEEQRRALERQRAASLTRSSFGPSPPSEGLPFARGTEP